MRGPSTLSIEKYGKMRARASMGWRMGKFGVESLTLHSEKRIKRPTTRASFSQGAHAVTSDWTIENNTIDRKWPIIFLYYIFFLLLGLA